MEYLRTEIVHLNDEFQIGGKSLTTSGCHQIYFSTVDMYDLVNMYAHL